MSTETTQDRENEITCICGGMINQDHHGRLWHYLSNDNKPCNLHPDRTVSRKIIAGN